MRSPDSLENWRRAEELMFNRMVLKMLGLLSLHLLQLGTGLEICLEESCQAQVVVARGLRRRNKTLNNNSSSNNLPITYPHHQRLFRRDLPTNHPNKRSHRQHINHLLVHL